MTMRSKMTDCVMDDEYDETCNCILIGYFQEIGGGMSSAGRKVSRDGGHRSYTVAD